MVALTIVPNVKHINADDSNTDIMVDGPETTNDVYPTVIAPNPGLPSTLSVVLIDPTPSPSCKPSGENEEGEEEEEEDEKDEEKPHKMRKTDAVSLALRKRQTAEIVLSKFFRKNRHHKKGPKKIRHCNQ